MNKLRKVQILEHQKQPDGKFEFMPVSDGWFHGLFQYGEGVDSECLAVIELMDGRMKTVFPHLIKFVVPYKEHEEFVDRRSANCGKK